LLIDDIRRVEPVNVSTLPPIQPRRAEIGGRTDRDALRAALRAAEARDLGRTFSLRQVRDIVEVRELAPEIGLEDVTFRTGSAAIQPSEAEQLREIGLLMRELIRENPREVFLVEGYTDAVGNAAFNLLLSDRRAESVALALTEYFDVPPENMVVQGYGERFLKIPTLEAERLNRRVSVRRITNLIAQG
jgi:outer membrane protein OmpA-like peptidoglycan-associated protein